jgi:hypothetical protein
MKREGEIGGKAKHKDQKKKYTAHPRCPVHLRQKQSFQISQVKSNQIKSNPVISSQIK